MFYLIISVEMPKWIDLFIKVKNIDTNYEDIYFALQYIYSHTNWKLIRINCNNDFELI